MTTNLTLKQELERCERWLEDKTIEYNKVKKELEELKRYPTADEVCEALGEYYRKLMMDIYYDEKLNSFCYGEYGDISVEVGLDKYGNLKIKEYLPPHLITLIGRFYEGLNQ